MLQFNAPPGWPQAPRGWRPPAGWQPDEEWPPPPPGWELFLDRRRTWVGWFAAAGACVPLGLVLLLVALGTKSLDLVYLSIAVTVGTLPLAAVGTVSFVRWTKRS